MQLSCENFPITDTGQDSGMRGALNLIGNPSKEH